MIFLQPWATRREAITTSSKVDGMTRPGIEPCYSGPGVNAPITAPRRRWLFHWREDINVLNLNWLYFGSFYHFCVTYVCVLCVIQTNCFDSSSLLAVRKVLNVFPQTGESDKKNYFGWWLALPLPITGANPGIWIVSISAEFLRMYMSRSIMHSA